MCDGRNFVKLFTKVLRMIGVGATGQSPKS